MPHQSPELHHHRTRKKGDPLLTLTIHQFLSQHYSNLSNKLEEYLISERDQYDAEIKGLERRSAREDGSLWAFATLYPNTVPYSMFIALYQQFEFTMIEACTEMEKDYPNSKKLSELKGKGIQLAEAYLRKVVGISTPFEPTEWKKLKELNSLRNIIIHNDAIIKTDQVDRINLVQRINQWAPVTIQETRTVLSEHFIERTSQFLYEQADYLGRQLLSAGWE